MIEPAQKHETHTPRSLAKRQQIIQAAQHLFLRDGFTTTSMEAIRAEAQVSKPTLYNHFDSKEALFVGIAEEELDELSRLWLPAAAEQRPITSQEQLRAVLYQFASTALDRLLAPQRIRLAHTLLAEARAFPELGRGFRERIPQRVFSIVTAMLNSAHDHGVLAIEREKISLAARIFAAQLLSYLLIDGLLLVDEPARRPPAEEIETILDLYLRMIC